MEPDPPAEANLGPISVQVLELPGSDSVGAGRAVLAQRHSPTWPQPLLKSLAGEAPPSCPLGHTKLLLKTGIPDPLPIPEGTGSKMPRLLGPSVACGNQSVEPVQM